MDIATGLLFVAGLVLLIVGAEWLVRGASHLATMIGMSPLVVGLTVVAFGTSAPEIAVSVQSAITGVSDIAVGNAVGSNIINILLILGLAAAIAPLIVARQLVRLDVPIMIAISVLLFLVGLDGSISRRDGLVFLVLLAGYFTFLIYRSRRAERGDPALAQPTVPSTGRWPLDLLAIAGGLAMLVLGSRWLVNGAVMFAQILGLSELVIGLTIVAAGTSLPEVATSVIASLRGERDIAVGNVVGSNILNILAVLGLASVVAPQGLAVSPAALHLDIPVMVAAAVACLPIFFTGHLIARWEGLLFLAYYITYTAYIVLDSTQHQSLPLFNAVMLFFVMPITAVTLGIITYRSMKTKT